MASVHGGDIYRNKIKYDFSVNLNPLGCPDSIVCAIKTAVSRIGEYPDQDQQELREALSKACGTDPECIICGSGASELFAGIVRAVGPKSALIAAPSFYGYEYALNMAEDCRIERCFLREEEEFDLTEEFLSKITDSTDMVFLCNPNNPTGKCIREDMLLKILERCKRTDTYLVADECFLELSTGAVSLVSRFSEFDKLIVVKAFTKLFAIPGVRFGFAIANRHLIGRIKKELPEWNISVFANAAGTEGAKFLLPDKGSLKDEKERLFLDRSKFLIETGRQFLTDSLKVMGIEVFSSDTCFILLKTDRDLSEHLLERGILIRDCSNFEGLSKGFYRIAVKDRKSNEVLVKAVREIMDGA